MKILYTSIFTLLFTLSSIGQNTFNIRTNYGFPAAVITSVVPTDSCIYASGIISDSVFPYNTGAIFLKTDPLGVPEIIKTLRNEARTYEPWFNDMKFVDSSFLVSAVGLNSLMKSMLIKYDLFGDTVWTREFPNPNPTLEFMQPRGGFELIGENDIVLINFTEVPPNGPFKDADVYFFKMKENGDIVWSKFWGGNLIEEPSSSILANDTIIIIGGMRHSLNIEDSDYSFQCFLLAIDTSGQIQWTWLSPESWGLRDAARDMVLLEDGSLVIACGIGHEQQRPSVNVVYFDKAVFKLNPQRELEWEVVFPDPELVLNSYTSRIIQLKNKSGFVVAGVAKRPTPPGVWGSNRGWIAKISPDGDSLWSRTYVYSTDFPSFHEFYDLKECPDGGLILCGESRSVANGDSIPQQAWLMKLDSFGCLVPGCQFIDATEETKESVTLLLYPNPARDYLNFFYRPAPGQSSRDIRFRIIDASGMELQRFEAQSGEATYIVPLWHWPPGVYFLQLLHDGLPVRTERFVVGR